MRCLAQVLGTLLPLCVLCFSSSHIGTPAFADAEEPLARRLNSNASATAQTPQRECLGRGELLWRGIVHTATLTTPRHWVSTNLLNWIYPVFVLASMFFAAHTILNISRPAEKMKCLDYPCFWSDALFHILLTDSDGGRATGPKATKSTAITPQPSELQSTSSSSYPLQRGILVEAFISLVCHRSNLEICDVSYLVRSGNLRLCPSSLFDGSLNFVTDPGAVPRTLNEFSTQPLRQRLWSILTVVHPIPRARKFIVTFPAPLMVLHWAVRLNACTLFVAAYLTIFGSVASHPLQEHCFESDRRFSRRFVEYFVVGVACQALARKSSMFFLEVARRRFKVPAESVAWTSDEKADLEMRAGVWRQKFQRAGIAVRHSKDAVAYALLGCYFAVAVLVTLAFFAGIADPGDLEFWIVSAVAVSMLLVIIPFGQACFFAVIVPRILSKEPNMTNDICQILGLSHIKSISSTIPDQLLKRGTSEKACTAVHNGLAVVPAEHSFCRCSRMSPRMPRSAIDGLDGEPGDEEASIVAEIASEFESFVEGMRGVRQSFRKQDSIEELAKHGHDKESKLSPKNCDANVLRGSDGELCAKPKVPLRIQSVRKSQRMGSITSALCTASQHQLQLHESSASRQQHFDHAIGRVLAAAAIVDIDTGKAVEPHCAISKHSVWV